MAVEPVTAIAEAIKEIAATIKLIFNGENRKILADVNRVADMRKALNEAEEAFSESDLIVPKVNKKYWKPRGRFDKYD